MKSLNKIVDAFQTMVHYPVKPSKRISVLIDIIKQYRQKGVSFREYYNFEFEKRSELFRRSYLGFNEERHYLNVLNPIKFYVLAYNKYLAHMVMSNAGIRTSVLYCYFQPDGKVYDSDEIANDIAEVCRILKKKKVHDCVVKAPEGSHGEGIFVLKNIDYKDDDAILTRFDGKSIALSEILKKEPLIFESLVHQTKQLANFNESSVNTVRFMTVLHPDGQAEILATFMKIGRAGKCVDNAGSGGNVDLCIDVETGVTKYAIQYDGWRNIRDIEKHPDNGSQLNGVVIDNWDNIKREVLKFQQAFPYCRAAGWDVAITDDGPVVLEVNDRWDTTGQYFIRKGWRSEIRNCYLEWKKENRNDDILPDRKSNLLSKKHLMKIEVLE